MLSHITHLLEFQFASRLNYRRYILFHVSATWTSTRWLIVNFDLCCGTAICQPP